MGVHSGKFGIVNGYTHVRNWNVNEDSSPERYRASNTVFGMFTNNGINDWEGSFSGFGGEPPVSIMPGSLFTFQGYTAPGTDLFGNDGTIYSGSAIVDSITINWDWQPSQSLNWTCNFSAASGDLAVSQGIYADTAKTVPQKMCGLIFETGAAAAEVTWDNLVSASLTLTADNIVYINSSTSCFTGRKPGPFDWSLSVTEQNELRPFAKNTNKRIRAHVGPSSYWILEWGHLVGYSGLTVDIETGAILEKTANFVMHGTDGTDYGQVVHPDDTVIWPETSTPS